MTPERLEQLGALTKRIVDPDAQAAIDELVAEVERLQALLRAAEFSCPWCRAIPHQSSCPAFTPEGEVK